MHPVRQLYSGSPQKKLLVSRWDAIEAESPGQAQPATGAVREIPHGFTVGKIGNYHSHRCAMGLHVMGGRYCHPFRHVCQCSGIGRTRFPGFPPAGCGGLSAHRSPYQLEVLADFRGNSPGPSRGTGHFPGNPAHEPACQEIVLLLALPLSEVAHKVGRLLFGRNFRVWRWLDIALRSVKYLLLLLFVKLILLDMPVAALGGFLDAPYWAVSDVKMLHFFTRMSVTTIVVLASLTLLSLLYKNVWCRYLCPYGALLGLVSLLSPFKIRRDSKGCTGCQRCHAACPSGLSVHTGAAVSSPECTGCLTCVASCPEPNVLAMQPVFWRRPLPAWGFPAVVLFIFMAGVGAGMASGHWQSSLSYADYQRLIPLVPYLSH